jgi:mannitol/fructose-specific phosphotransferase system IIA component (Ntr-type)
MQLRNFLDQTAVKLALGAASREEALAELVALLGLESDPSAALVRALARREAAGSTGVGRGVAIPHTRSPLVPELRLAYGRSPGGIEFQALDARPVHHLFLIVAPHEERANAYLPVLGRIAEFVRGPEVPARLAALTDPAEFFALLEERGV